MSKAAIIVPFRDSYNNGERYKELEKLSHRVSELCSKHNKPYKIFVIHQKDNFLFNRASLMNVGAAIAMQECDYFIFHDVDHIAVNNDNVYRQRDISGCLVCQQGDQIIDDNSTFFGAVTYVRKEDYLAINGFSNYFWGWGWEDCSILRRFNLANITVKRGDVKFIQDGHEAGHRWNGNINLINNIIIFSVIGNKLNDGFNNLKYQMLGSSIKYPNVIMYDVKIQSPQYDTSTVLTKTILSNLVGDYDSSEMKGLIPIYAKDIFSESKMAEVLANL